jgi:8-oxo-dGTP diphosphatase
MTVEYKNPAPTVDIIIEIEDGTLPSGHPRIVLIKRRNPPFGWAIPGGFVDYGETLETAAAREAMEETGLAVTLVRQFHAYSDPARDPRKHTISTVFIARARGVPIAADDAAEARVFPADALPEPMAFDHADILRDYREGKY